MCIKEKLFEEANIKALNYKLPSVSQARPSVQCALTNICLNFYFYFPLTVLNESEILLLFQYEVQVTYFHDYDENIIPAHFSIP